MTSPLYDDITLAAFYDSGQKTERLDHAFCLNLAQSAPTILDLGCGTGELAIAASAGGNKHVVAVDPAKAMLQIAGAKTGADRVNWVNEDARTVRLHETFDLVILTGHTFQVFLKGDDRLACLKTIACHLKQGGLFVFDSRNPDCPAPKENTRERSLRTFAHPELGEIECWNVSHYDQRARILSYSNHFHVLETGERFSGEERIAYTPQKELADLLDQAGLHTDRWLGDWKGTPFQDESYDIIPVGQRV